MLFLFLLGAWYSHIYMPIKNLNPLFYKRHRPKHDAVQGVLWPEQTQRTVLLTCKCGWHHELCWEAANQKGTSATMLLLNYLWCIWMADACAMAYFQSFISTLVDTPVVNFFIHLNCVVARTMDQYIYINVMHKYIHVYIGPWLELWASFLFMVWWPLFNLMWFLNVWFKIVNIIIMFILKWFGLCSWRDVKIHELTNW